jgi:hypothetical protein
MDMVASLDRLVSPTTRGPEFSTSRFTDEHVACTSNSIVRHNH